MPKYDCPNGHRNHLDNVITCTHAACQTKLCPDCTPELNWMLEACPEHLDATVYRIQRERDALRLLIEDVRMQMKAYTLSIPRRSNLEVSRG